MVRLNNDIVEHVLCCDSPAPRRQRVSRHSWPEGPESRRTFAVRKHGRNKIARGRLRTPTMSKEGDARLGSIIVQGDSGELVLLGYPCDEGVRRNGGRVGAALAPAAVRKQMPRMGTVYNPELDVDLSKLTISDGGDVQGKGLNDFETCCLFSRVAIVIVS